MPAAVLSRIHCRVGKVQQINSVSRIQRREGVANRDAHPAQCSPYFEWFMEGVQELLAKDLGLRRARKIRCDDDKFITADPGDRITGT